MAQDHDSRSRAADAPAPSVAVALGWDPATDAAPKVLASGRGAVAEQILQLAWASGVKVREDADLAQILAALDLDTEIPVEAYAAVAEIMLYVYRANGQEIPPQAAAGTFGP